MKSKGMLCLPPQCRQWVLLQNLLPLNLSKIRIWNLIPIHHNLQALLSPNSIRFVSEMYQ